MFADCTLETIWGVGDQRWITGEEYAEYEKVTRQPRFHRDEGVIMAALDSIREKGLLARPAETVRACAVPDETSSWSAPKPPAPSIW